MPSVGQFLSLLEAVSRRDWKAIKEIGNEVAADEKKKRHFTAAHRISEAAEIASATAPFDLSSDVSFANGPISGPIPDILHLDDVGAIVKPVVATSVERQIDELIFEWRSIEKLRNSGLKPRQTLLLYGPPGCGKTHLSRYVAKALEMRLYTVRFDTLISSLLGETGTNIRKIFEFAASNKCVIFIDEIDAIAKLRDDKNELGELKRVVITLLQNLDISNSGSLIIAATNHPHVLDPALWRRFSLVIDVGLPDERMREKLFATKLVSSLKTDITNCIVKATSGLSGSDLSTIITSAQRKALLESDLSLDESILLSALDFRRRQQGFESIKSSDEFIVMLTLQLRKSFRDKYSFHTLEALTGIPHSTIHNKMKSSEV